MQQRPPNAGQGSGEPWRDRIPSTSGTRSRLTGCILPLCVLIRDGNAAQEDQGCFYSHPGRLKKLLHGTECSRLLAEALRHEIISTGSTRSLGKAEHSLPPL